MATRSRMLRGDLAPKRTTFQDKLRAERDKSKRTVNTKLEAMLDALLDSATKADSTLTFTEKMAVGKLALAVEAVRNKLQDDDYGTGFLDERYETSPRPEPEKPEDE